MNLATGLLLTVLTVVTGGIAMIVRFAGKERRRVAGPSESHAAVAVEISEGDEDLEYSLRVVGVTKPNADGTDRQAILRTCRVGEPILLVREPGNAFDPNAIRVCRANGQQIGYIAADNAAWLAPDYLDRLHRVIASIESTGSPPGSPSTLGCIIRVTISRQTPPAAGNQVGEVEITEANVDQIVARLNRKTSPPNP